MALASGGKRKESITLNTPHCRVPNSAFFLRGWKVHWRMRQATWRFILELACTTCYIVTPYELVSSLASSFRGRFKIDQKMFRIALLAVYSPLRSSAQLPSPASLSLPFSCRLHTLTLLSPLSVADHQPPNALVHQRRPSSSGSISGSSNSSRSSSTHSISRRAAATSRSSTTTTTTIITTTGSKRGATTSISSSSGRSSSGGGTAIRTARMRGAMRTHSPGSSTSRGHGSAVRGNNSAASSGLAVRGGRLLVNALPVGSAAVPQRYLPQCRPCSQQQAAVLRNGTTSLVLSRGWRAVPKVSSTESLAAIGDQEPISAASVDRVVRERDMESDD